MTRLEVLAVEGLPEVHPGDDLAELIASHANLESGDVVVVAQKVVSKAEGRIRHLADVVAGDEAKRIAPGLIAAPDPRVVQIVLDESVRVLRSERVLITETKHGFVSANAGVDHSNVPGDDAVLLLPDDPDASALRLRERLGELTGARVGVIVSDTFGRPWRVGIVNVALGIAGVPSVIDLRGTTDDMGKELRATVLAVADDLAAAAGLVMGKTRRTPVVIVRGFERGGHAGKGHDMIRPAAEDLFPLKVVVLAGGTGGAKLAAGFAAQLEPADLTVIANTGDDEEFWGLLVCPDVDAVIYRLAGVFNDQAGYGQKGETFHALEALERLGEQTWFRIGDRDMATHVLRAEMLRRGATLTEACLELCRRFSVHARVLPMTDQPVRTRCITASGAFSLQEYFVRERLEPALVAIEFDGMEAARPSGAVLRALGEADLVVIGPSNPLISIDPILRVVGSALRRERTVAVTPLVGGVALKGPTVEMMRALGLEVSPVEVARRYREVASRFALDEIDRDLAPSIEALGYKVTVGGTVMDDGGVRLAALLLQA